MKGFIKLPREFLDNKELCKSKEHLCLFVHILSQAAYEDGSFCVFGGKRVDLKKGQMVSSIRKLAEETGISKSTVARILEHFKKWDVVRTEGGTRQTLITVAFLAPCETELGTENERNVGQNRDTDGEKRKEAKEKSIIKRTIGIRSKKKEIYGVFENVKLTNEEFESFKAKFPVNYSRYIDDLSHYIASRGDKYKSHYATLLTWNRNKSDEPSSMSSFDTDEFFQAAVRRSAERIRERANAHKDEKANDTTDLGW